MQEVESAGVRCDVHDLRQVDHDDPPVLHEQVVRRQVAVRESGAREPRENLHHLSEQPLGYAAKWHMHLHDEPHEHGRALDRWTAHFEAEGIMSIATGAIVLRRTDQEPRLSGMTWSIVIGVASGESGYRISHDSPPRALSGCAGGIAITGWGAGPMRASGGR